MISVQYAVVDGKHGEFQAAGDADFVKYSVEVVLDCLLRQRTLLGNVPIRQSINNGFGNLTLAWRETKTLFRRQ